MTKYIVKTPDNKHYTLTVVGGSIPDLGEGYEVLGQSSDLPEIVAAMEAESNKNAQIKAAYDQMNADVYAQMETVFETKNPESATAYNETYKLMMESPADFVGADFVDEAAVLAFAGAKLLAIKNYALFRLARIKQFQAEKEAILDS